MCSTETSLSLLSQAGLHPVSVLACQHLLGKFCACFRLTSLYLTSYRLQSVTRATAVNSYIPFSNEVIKRYFYPHLKNGLYIIIRLKVVASPTKTTLLSRNMLSKTVRINTTKIKLHKQFLLMELNFRFDFSFTSQSLASQCCLLKCQKMGRGSKSIIVMYCCKIYP